MHRQAQGLFDKEGKGVTLRNAAEGGGGWEKKIVVDLSALPRYRLNKLVQGESQKLERCIKTGKEKNG